MPKNILLRVVCLYIYMVAASAAGQSPRIAYSDLVSGPATGGAQNLGAIVTLTGSSFGTSQVSSTVVLACNPVSRILRHRVA